VRVVEWGVAALESSRPGTQTRLHASARTGTARLCVGEQWLEPGNGTPLARHDDGVEEVISVLAGVAEVRVDDEERRVRAGETVIIPGGALHQLVAVGPEPLHVWFAFSASAPVTYVVEESGSSFTIG
jgi:quercetin dioxygenase-like cupin family protein